MTTRDLSAERKVREFYDSHGWTDAGAGVSVDAELWEDLRPVARHYVESCRRKILKFLPQTGDLLLDAASGPIQYPEYLEYSKGLRKRVCVDISKSALEQAEKRLGNRGEYVQASILNLPFPSDQFDAIVSLHTIYHIESGQQDAAVRQLVRVAKTGAPVVIVYANPNRLIQRARRLASPFSRKQRPKPEPLYYHAHPLAWWDRFRDSASVKLHPWRSLTARESKTLIPNNVLGKILFRGVLATEDLLPGPMTALGAYPVIVLRK
jgi:ubiquinone/menaquinone biosynthesis C-methylase UbiE